MAFTSNLYLAFALAVVVIFFGAPFRFRQWVLLVASLLFYMKWSVTLVPLIVYVILINYLAAILMTADLARPRRKAILTAAVIGNLAVLAVFKYLNFLVGSAAAIAGIESFQKFNLLLPIGISFYTFKGMSYCIDVYRGKYPPYRSLLDVSLYITFFPTLLAGPIVRADQTILQFHQQTNPDLARFTRGALMIAGGLFKKIFIADLVAQYVNQVFDHPAAFSGATRLVAAYGFTLQIYCDFSGYSDVAIGTGVLFGYQLMENFRYPYLATSLKDFWRRWHISLSTWLRDYLYISLGGSRRGRLRGYLALFLTMLLGGLWHGANYTFIVWGGLHGAALALERWAMNRGLLREPTTSLSRAFRILIYFQVVTLLWVFFRADTISAAFAIIGGVFTWSAGQELGLWPVYLLLLLMGYEILSRQKSIIPQLLRSPLAARFVVYAVLLTMISIFAGSRSQEFIYFKF